ncbi:MFS transporter [Legionella cardiaca]|uniref:MFS transporter n=1 Tax=Legionella cardiaca TaxID=1071983 RepID=A0ABY8AUP4_9GAMM|nr:MFS transporter [Legionella cardiaca]WED43240.1 MFS transporter [Legionella cardiaca]
MKHQTRILVAGMLGNLVEAFDLALCGLLSVYLAKYLIGDVTKGLLIVFATFFAGYLARPIGAIFMGLFSDIYGRKITLAASILSMGISTTLIGFIPSSNSIGIASIACLLILRIIQSFSCGAEYLNSSAYLIENAETSNKGYSGSWASFGTMAGLLVASLFSLIITYLIECYPELGWAIWRIPFILALLGSSIGLYIRMFIPESKEYINYYANNTRPKLKNLCNQSLQYLFKYKSKCLYVFALSSLGVATTFQIYIYGPTQAHIYGNFTDYQIIKSNIISLMVLLCVFPIFGKLSDKVKREGIIVAAIVGFLLLLQPFFYLLSYGTYNQFILIQALISIPAGAYYATVPVMLAEMFPFNLRCTVLSLLYSTAASISAGLTPLLSLMLLRKTQSSISPPLVVIILVIFSFVTMWFKYAHDNKMIKLN